MTSAYQDISRLRVTPKFPKESVPVRANLTPRESVVMEGIMGGRSNKEIARALDISPRTVEFHRANLLKKCGAKNTAVLVRKALGD
jgi:DNA-binding NarL/FixJ family response regulator